MDNNQKEKKSQKRNFVKLSQGEKSGYLIKKYIKSITSPEKDTKEKEIQKLLKYYISSK